MIKFQGVWPIIPTPLTPEEDVDESTLRKIIQYVIEGGVHGIWMLGSGGEGPMLSSEVSRRTLAIAVEEAKGHVPVAAGISAFSLRQALVNMNMAREAGVDVVFSTEPKYYKLSADMIVEYFLALADARELPLVVYHWPNAWPSGSMTAGSITNTLGRLAKHPNIVGMKDVTGDPRDFQRLIFALGSEDFTIMTAAGRLLFITLALGGHGGAFLESVIAPKLYVDLYESFKGGDLSRTRELQRKLAPLGDVLNAPFCGGGASVKQALNFMGLCSLYMSKPLKGMDDEDRGHISSVMKELKLI